MHYMNDTPGGFDIRMRLEILYLMSFFVPGEIHVSLFYVSIIIHAFSHAIKTLLRRIDNPVASDKKNSFWLKLCLNLDYNCLDLDVEIRDHH